MREFNLTLDGAWQTCWLVLLASLGCAMNPNETISDQLFAREPLCLAVDWIAAPPPWLEGRRPADTLMLRPSQGPRNSWAKDYDLWGDVALIQGQQDRRSAGSVWGMARDSLHIFGSSVFETMRLILVEPKRQADWFYSKDLGESLQGRARLSPFECGPQMTFVP